MKTYKEYIKDQNFADKNEFLILNYLNELKCEFYIHEHPPLRTVEESKNLRGEIDGAHSKNLFLRDKKKNNYLITTKENQKIDLKNLEKNLLTGRLSFGSPDRLHEFLGVRPGSVSPFALINDPHNKVLFYIDKNLFSEKVLNFHPLINNLTISIKLEDFELFLNSINRVVNELEFK